MMRATATCRNPKLAVSDSPFGGRLPAFETADLPVEWQNPPFRHRKARLLVLDRRRPWQPRLAAVRFLLEGAVRQRQLPGPAAAQMRNVRLMPELTCSAQYH